MSEADRVAILLVDDRPENLLSLQEILRAPDREIITAPSGPEGLKAMLSHEVAVVLLDVQMPGMDGYEVARLMRRRRQTRAVPVIFVTAGDRSEAKVFTGYESGAVDYLFKPLNPDIVASKVAVFVELFRQRKLVEAQRAGLAAKVTELDAARIELQRSNADLQAFAYAASHDLKAPLRNIDGFLGLIERSLGDGADPKIARYLGHARTSAARMQALIAGLLDYSRADRPEEPACDTDLNPLADAVVADLHHTLMDAGATVTRGALPTLCVEGGRIAQLLQNLITNGVKFRGEAAPTVHLDATEADEGWEITVADNGIGIAADQLDRIFEVFTRVHGSGSYEGSGIGLATCRRIVDRHGGRIWATSVVGEGTTFHVWLPGDRAPGGAAASA